MQSLMLRQPNLWHVCIAMGGEAGDYANALIWGVRTQTEALDAACNEFRMIGHPAARFGERDPARLLL